MYPSKFLITLLCLLTIGSCKTKKSDESSEIQNVPSSISLSGNVSISGAYALAPLMKMWANDFTKMHPDVIVEVRETGTGQGISELLEKKAVLAMISRPLTDSDRQAGVWVIPVAKDGVAVIINQENPYLHRLQKQGLSPDKLQKIFTTDKPVTWSEILDTAGSDKISVFSRADESGAAEIFAGFFYMHASDLKGNKVTGDNEMIKSVSGNRLAIGFCNFSFAFDINSGNRIQNIELVPLDVDFNNKTERKEKPFRTLEEAHRSVWLGIYPSALCRELTIGSVGKPEDPVVKEFLKYILSEGQEQVEKMGLCKLNNVYLRYSRECLK